MAPFSSFSVSVRKKEVNLIQQLASLSALQLVLVVSLPCMLKHQKSFAIVLSIKAATYLSSVYGNGLLKSLANKKTAKNELTIHWRMNAQNCSSFFYASRTSDSMWQHFMCPKQVHIQRSVLFPGPKS